jgi:hypothetical protein
MSKRMMTCGLQMQAGDFDKKDAGAVFDHIQESIPLDAASVFAGKNIRREAGHQGGSRFHHPQVGLDEQGRDVLDRMLEAGASRGVRVIMGIGEESWGYQEQYPGYTTIGMVDQYGRIHRQSCVNHPAWRDFQVASMEDTVRLHPELDSYMFMHERSGPLAGLFGGAGAGFGVDGGKAYCFCEHCCRKGRERGIDPQRAREGGRQLAKLVEAAQAGAPRPTDGWFINVWRVLMRYPDMLAWDQLWWDSLHDYRANLVGAIKAVRPEAEVGFHFQHATLMSHWLWRAGDDPARVTEYADWIKPSVYPGASGGRAGNQLRRMHTILFKDMPISVAREFTAWICGHDPATLPDYSDPDRGQCAFGADWVQREIDRLATACAPRPVYAGLGIGIPGGDRADTVELIRDCTEACYAGGAKGVLLSRHFSEMRPELLAAAGEVIRRHVGQGEAVTG